MLAWRDLVHLSDVQLGACDVAEVNLACAEGLPGADRIDVAFCLRTLDQWAELVLAKAKAAYSVFRRNSRRWDDSEAIFRIHCMISVLQRDCGVCYNTAKIAGDAVFAPDDTFIHGVIQGVGGTCSSLPVVYAAIGRRLGYPLFLVSAKGTEYQHQFIRWDDRGGERFNVEVNNHGFDCPPDDYYRTGLYTVSEDVERRGGFLKSKTPREELASFLAERGLHWRESSICRQAADSFAWATAIAPQNEQYLNALKKILNEWTRNVERRKPPGFPELYIKADQRRFPQTMPLDVERYILGLEAVENVLSGPDQRWQRGQAIRGNERLPKTPRQALVDFAGRRCEISFESVPFAW